MVVVSKRFRRSFFGPPNGRLPNYKVFEASWVPRVHFAVYPVSTLGNWIPRVLSQWYCSGHGCGFDQIVVENVQGKELTTYL